MDVEDPGDGADRLPVPDKFPGQLLLVRAHFLRSTEGDAARLGGHPAVVRPAPRSTAVPSDELNPPTQRDHHLAMITERGRLVCQVATDHGQRSLVEMAMSRYKALIGPRLRARGVAAQQTKAAIGVAILNKMLAAGRPRSVRCQSVIA